jgi:hypothetical protein
MELIKANELRDLNEKRILTEKAGELSKIAQAIHNASLKGESKVQLNYVLDPILLNHLNREFGYYVNYDYDYIQPNRLSKFLGKSARYVQLNTTTITW